MQMHLHLKIPQREIRKLDSHVRRFEDQPTKVFSKTEQTDSVLGIAFASERISAKNDHVVFEFFTALIG